jgi:hypothetical protein
MTARPYPVMRLAKSQPIHFGSRQTSLLVELELADRVNLAVQTERISIQTLVPTPLPDPQHGVELAALERARALIDAQIEALLQST